MTKLKTAFKWLAIVGGSLLSLALLALAFFNWQAGVCLEEQLRPLKATREPMSLADLAPAPTAPDRNAGTYLRRAENSVMAMMHELAPLGEKYDDYYANGRLNERGVELVKTAFAAYPDAVPLLERAADAPDYVPDHDFTQPPQAFLEPYLQKVQQSRAFARILQYRAELLLAQQNREESLRTSLVFLRLTRHFEREPILIGYLVAVAVQSMAVNQIANALNDGPVSSELHDQLSDELSRALASQSFVAALKSERAYGIDSFRDLRGTGPPIIGFKRDECDYLKRIAAEIEIGAAPQYKVEAELAKMSAASQAAGTLTRLVVPALEAAREAHQRLHARLQCLTVLNALTRREESPDANAASIEELGLPAEITTDPYNGQPLRIIRTQSEWIVYSVGPNQKDDGGNIEKNEDVGVGPKG